MNTYMKSTRARLEMLERQNRWLTIIAGATIVMLLIAAIGGPVVIRATSIKKADETDNVRTELTLKNDAVGRYIKEEHGKDRLQAIHNTEDAGLYLRNDQKTTRTGIAQFAHGVALHRVKPEGAAVLNLKDEGRLRFFDNDGILTNEIVASASER